ncbi:hypothetical protein GCM10022200_09060 [Microbacterium awajiense]|uniref:Transcriptional regulator n=1 Tax=Microbacterium awajiense TaxID=415214 RepID=A0ABP7ABM5_9MICO
MTTTQDKLDDRYGRRRSRSTPWFIAGFSVVAAVALGLLTWSTVTTAADAVDVDTTGYAVVDERTVTVNFQVSAAAGRTIACIIEAQDEEHGVVGWRVVELAASDDHARAFRETIPTVAPATTGLVNSCWVT